MNLETNIVPILYMGATGGNFMANLLSSASRKDFRPKILSKYGNAHAQHYGIHETPEANNNRFHVPDELKVADVFKHKPDHTGYVWFTNLHSRNAELMLKHFSKVIWITYESEDVVELSTILVGKMHIDEKQKEISVDKIEMYYNMSLLYLQGYVNTFVPIINDRILNVSWKEIYHLDIDILLNKLIEFTKIPKQDFDIPYIENWRNATSEGINMVNKYIRGENHGL